MNWSPSHLSLLHLFQKGDKHPPSSVEGRLLYSLLDPPRLDLTCLEADIDQMGQVLLDKTPECEIGWLKLLLGTALVLSFEAYPPDLKEKLEHVLQEKKGHLCWKKFQLSKTLISLIEHLLGVEAKLDSVQLSSSGFVLREAQGYHSLASLPNPFEQAESALFFAMIGILANRQDFLAAAKSAAEWILYTLDANAMPMIGLYTSENSASIAAALACNYLLFQTLALVDSDKRFKTLAQRQIVYLEKFVENQLAEIPILYCLIESWIQKVAILPENNEALSLEDILPAAYQDLAANLIGCRSPHESIACTLVGEYSGMGCYQVKDLGVISFGPQHLPLGDCRGFGLASGGMYSPSKILEMKREGDGFFLKGIVKMAPRACPYLAHGYLLEENASWMKISSVYQPGQLLIEVQFLEGFENNQMAFSYFVKAEACQVNKNQCLYPKTLSKYQGNPSSALFKTNQTSLEIKALQGCGEMHVVPLAGGKNFWGADFLISFVLSSEKRTFRWSLESHL